MTKGIFSWSGGKESAFALYNAQKRSDVSVDNLFTFYSQEHQRVSYHGLRTDLVEYQADALGFPIDLVSLPANCSSEEYFEIVSKYLRGYKERDVEKVVFGDTYVVREPNLREDTVSEVNMNSYYPLEGKDTGELIHEFVKAGFKATTISVDADDLGWDYLGRIIDQEFIDDLPDDVDPCGENGAYHSFVWDGPIFNKSINIKKGEKEVKEVAGDTLYYCDIKAI